MEPKKQIRLLIAANVFWIAAFLVAAKYETPKHKKADALSSLIGFDSIESLSLTHPIAWYTNAAISKDIPESSHVNWVGVEWTHIYSNCRTHATTPDGKRYIVHLQLEPNEEQNYTIRRYEVKDVTEQVSQPGMEFAGIIETPEMFEQH
jgi:hypothetical protein